MARVRRACSRTRREDSLPPRKAGPAAAFPPWPLRGLGLHFPSGRPALGHLLRPGRPTEASTPRRGSAARVRGDLQELSAWNTNPWPTFVSLQRPRCHRVALRGLSPLWENPRRRRKDAGLSVDGAEGQTPVWGCSAPWRSCLGSWNSWGSWGPLSPVSRRAPAPIGRVHARSSPKTHGLWNKIGLRWAADVSGRAGLCSDHFRELWSRLVCSPCGGSRAPELRRSPVTPEGAFPPVCSLARRAGDARGRPPR